MNVGQNVENDNPDYDDDSNGDDDDSPPPIYFHNTQRIDCSPSKREKSFSSVTNSSDVEIQTCSSSSTSSKSKQKPSNISNPHSASATALHPIINDTPLAEILLQDAEKANRLQSKQQQLNERKKAQTSTFGFQKGFLSSSSAKKKKQSNRKGKDGHASGVKDKTFVREIKTDGTPNDLENVSASTNIIFHFSQNRFSFVD